MERPTLRITLPISKTEVEFYSYITAGEKRQITEILTAGMSANVSGQVNGDIPLATLFASNDKALELLVVKIGDKTSNLVEIINSMHSVDAEFLVDEINKISNNADYNKKKAN